MKKYLLDTNICIYYLKGQFELDKRILDAGLENCYISVITLAELKFGVANSAEIKKENNQKTLDNFLGSMEVIPLENCLDMFAEIKTKLKKSGNMIDNFDLLIASTALTHEMVLVTRNIKHFQRIENLQLENWIDEA